MISQLYQITFGALHNAPWFIICFGLLILLCYRYIKKQSTLHVLAKKMPSLIASIVRIKNSGKLICMSLGILFLFIALLRPQSESSEEIIAQEGRDLYIALDVSRSMLATDVLPNRLIWAKEKIKRLVKQLSCDRIGLIIFSNSAFVQCPLTTDYAAFHMYLDTVDAELVLSGATSIGTAISQALKSFSATPERKTKLVALFTDGEDFSPNLAEIKQKASDTGLSIFTIGIGTVEGAPVPLFDALKKQIGHQKDSKGAVVISRLNETTLKTISQDVGGIYIKGQQTDEDITTLTRLISAFEKEKLHEKKIHRAYDLYHYCLLTSFICFIIEWLL